MCATIADTSTQSTGTIAKNARNPNSSTYIINTKTMSGKKMKKLRKAAAQIAVKLPERNYSAIVGTYLPIGSTITGSFEKATSGMIQRRVEEFPRNRMRVAKNAVAWEVKMGRMKI